jgi:hypothetical protein
MGCPCRCGTCAACWSCIRGGTPACSTTATTTSLKQHWRRCRAQTLSRYAGGLWGHTQEVAPRHKPRSSSSSSSSRGLAVQHGYSATLVGEQHWGCMLPCAASCSWLRLLSSFPWCWDAFSVTLSHCHSFFLSVIVPTYVDHVC